MNNIKPIMVTGPYTCGKGTLISLLDSPSVFTIPQWHDMLIDIFYKFQVWFNTEYKTKKSWRGGKDERIIQLRKLLSEQDYPMLEQYSMQKQIVFPISSEKFETFEFNFDYYNHEKEFFESINELDNESINVQTLLNLFLKSFIKNLKNTSQQNYKYFVSAAEPGFCNFENLINLIPEIKIIYIDRKDWFLSYANRLANENLDPFNSIFKDKRFTGIINAEKLCNVLENKYPDNFKVIRFEDLITNSEVIMDYIVDFIGLEKNDIYKIPTFLTQKIQTKDIIGKVQDKIENLKLLPSQILTLQREYYKRYGTTQLIKKDLVTYIEPEPLKLVDSKDISVVIQGEISDKKQVQSCIHNIRRYLPSAEIVLSTWENTNVDKLDYDILVSSRDPGGFDMQPVTWKKNNVNRQIISTINGIKKANRKYVLKLRTDCLIKNSNFLKYFNSRLMQNLKRVKEYSVFKNRILIDSLFTRNSEYNSCTQVGLCFHPSDIWMFGLKEDLEMLFDIPLQNQYIVNINGKNYQYRTPEQYLWTNCLEKNNWSIFMDTCLYNTPYTSECSLNSIINNFFVLNHKKSGIKFPKKFKKHPKFTFKYVLTTKRYLELYKEYISSSYKIPKEFKYETLNDVFGLNKYITELKDLLKPFNFIAKILKPFSFIIKIPLCLIKILLKVITNSYKLIWWLQ